MTDQCHMTIHEAAGHLKSGAATSRQLCERVLARIAAVEARVNALSHLDKDTVLAAADTADRRRAAGQELSPYDGIPLAIKDNMAVHGQPCACGSRVLAGFTSPYNATAVQKLLDRGFIPCGRTNMDEFAMGSSTETSAFKTTANPWDLTRVPGGSSGGSAAAVAAGEAIAALGSDTGGSIRQPASFCGVVGLKPTYGRVSRYGLVAYASSLDQIGPLTKDVRDAAILLETLSGHDPMDSTSLNQPVEDYAAQLDTASARGLRIGMPREFFDVTGLAPEVRQAIEDAAATYQGMGAELVPVDLPHTKYAVATYYIIATAEASSNLARFDGIRYGARDQEAGDLLSTYRKTREKGFGLEVKRRIILGTYVLSSGYYDAYYNRAQKVRTLIREDYTNAFTSCDVILAPASPFPAFKVGEITDPLTMYLADIYTISVNLAGICGISIPCALTRGGLPVGMQLLGPAFGESAILKAARVFEQQSPLAGKMAEL
ncbi:MAG: Asp-tRNA(Asn)/Glu-tRNA(Gln) amidotransferase subunit GatA [Lentisphaeria bacterium]|nr:Asp-tRNA(Asn)/Glu-tRNA(Gln) amidotransferase subunit GatA [Lentisphaeria bacterium]